MNTKETVPVKQETGKENNEMLKSLAELKKMIEQNANLATAVETEPRKVLTKSYIEGTPGVLKGLISNIIGSYAFDAKGNAIQERSIAVTFMIEDVTPKK